MEAAIKMTATWDRIGQNANGQETEGYPRIALVTNFPSYHNVDLLNMLGAVFGDRFCAFYLVPITADRQWTRLKEIRHEHEFVRERYITRHIYVNSGLVGRVFGWRPDLVILNQYASIGMQQLMYACGLRRKPWVLWAEAPHVRFTENVVVGNERLRSFLRWLALRPLRLAGPREIWCIGSHARLAYPRVANAPCVDMPYYFDVTFFEQAKRSSASEGQIRFLFAGKLIKRKGFDVLLEAIGRLKADGVHPVVQVVGNGPLRELDQKGSLVHYLGFREIHEMPETYAGAEVLVFPSRYDGWGMGIPEAMAAGMAVIASDACGSTQHCVVHGGNGFMIPAGCPNALAEKMRWMIEHPAEVRQMGNQGRNMVRKLDATTGAPAFQDAIRRILKNCTTGQ